MRTATFLLRNFRPAPRVASQQVRNAERGPAPVLPVTPTAASIDVRVPRAHFADFPRTEFRLYATASPARNETPRLVVFFLGGPDTTPELPTAGALEPYLAARIAPARAGTGSKRP